MKTIPTYKWCVIFLLAMVATASAQNSQAAPGKSANEVTMTAQPIDDIITTLSTHRLFQRAARSLSW